MRIRISFAALFLGAAVSAQEPEPWSPESYPDLDGFNARKQIVLEGLAKGGLDKWRRGYFAGGDQLIYLGGGKT